MISLDTGPLEDSHTKVLPHVPPVGNTWALSTLQNWASKHTEGAANGYYQTTYSEARH
jgi:hypothetical protein